MVHLPWSELSVVYQLKFEFSGQPQTTSRQDLLMKRRSFLTKTFALGAAIAASAASIALFSAPEAKTSGGRGIVVSTSKITPPANGNIPVAIAISEGATVIDFAGPWDVFGSVMIPHRGVTMAEQMPFDLFMVSDRLDPVTVEGGMTVVPKYTFANVPECKVAVIGAQTGSKEMSKWLRKIASTADVTVSVCVGVTQLARAGLLAGKSATTHHDSYDQFAKDYPDIDVRRGVRFVENQKISTSGGETCGIDLALRVVERYFGRKVAEQTAVFVEHEGNGWII
jgi:transcriptional regulator GlxA family with amidase domain